MFCAIPCACSRFVSLIQPFAVSFVPHYTAHDFIRSLHQLQHPACSCFVPQHQHFPTHKKHSVLFLPANLLTPKNRSPASTISKRHHRQCQQAVEIRITPTAPPGASYFLFQQPNNISIAVNDYLFQDILFCGKPFKKEVFRGMLCKFCASINKKSITD